MDSQTRNTADHLEAVARKAVADPAGPGCVIAVAGADRPLVSASRGQANVEHQVPIGADTVFHVASVSKQFTAYALDLLAQDGLLSHADPVVRHLPWFPFPDITLDQLVHHTSGLRDQWQLLEAAGRRMSDVITTDDVVELVRGQAGLNFRPGSRHLYSNTGFTLLALIVAEVAGTPLPEFCAERIFRPLRMTATEFLADHQKIVPRRADSYETSPAGHRRIALSYSTAGATSLNTTVADLARWALHTMDPEIRARREKAGVLTDGTPCPYGLGVRLGTRRGRPAVWHAGADAGYRSHLLVLPEERVAAIVLTNDGSIDAGALAEAALGLRPGPKPESGASDHSLEGLYFCPDFQEVLRLVASDGILHLADGPDDEISFRVDGGTVWLRTGHATPESRLDRMADPADRSTVDLESCDGLYYSDEVGAVVRLRLLDGQLRLSRGAGGGGTLRPMSDSLFVMDSSGESSTVTIAFEEDRSALFYSTPLAQRIRFRRLPEK